MPSYDALPTIPWNDDYRIAVDSIDRENERLFEALDAYVQAINSRLGAGIIRNKLVALESYFLLHFETEEEIIVLSGAPGFGRHQEEHQVFVRRLQVIRRMRQSETARAQELLAAFTAWVSNHLTTRDRELGRHVAGYRPAIPAPSRCDVSFGDTRQ